MTIPSIKHRFEYHTALSGIGIVILLWTAILGFALIHGGATWPGQDYTISKKEIIIHVGDKVPMQYGQEERWENFITIMAIVSFLTTKCWGMYRRTRRLDHLALSIILTNVAFLWVYLFTTGRILYPTWGDSIWWRRSIRWPLIITSIFATYEVCTVPDLSSSLSGTTKAVEEIKRLRLKNAQLESKLAICNCTDN